MTKREMKERAQDEILHYAKSVFYALADGMVDEELRPEIEKQMKRLGKLFGYDNIGGS